jgi:signal transduction histidine kinase
VHVEITDSGSGIDAQDIPFLFNQGFTTKGDGHGYGLHLSSVWAHEFGGTLECCSHGPGGATFRLRLPSPHLTGLETADDAAAVAS